MPIGEDLTPCPDTSRPQHPQADTVHGFSVDAELKPVLESLWADGVTTLCSCQGDRSVRHSVIGRAHDHEGFVAVPTFTDATRTFTWLEERQAKPFLSACSDGHDGTREYVVNFDPVTTWGGSGQAAQRSAAGLARDGVAWCVRTVPTVLVLILAMLGAAVVFSVFSQ